MTIRGIVNEKLTIVKRLAILLITNHNMLTESDFEMALSPVRNCTGLRLFTASEQLTNEFHSVFTPIQKTMHASMVHA